MKKNYFKITTVDGKEFLQPILNTLVGQPLNSMETMGAAIQIARSGFVLDPTSPQPEIVAPSQIVSVKIISQ